MCIDKKLNKSVSVLTIVKKKKLISPCSRKIASCGIRFCEREKSSIFIKKRSKTIRYLFLIVANQGLSHLHQYIF